MGIDKKGGIKANHKNNIPKVMVIVVNGYVFKNGFKVGGGGLNIGCYQTQGLKKAKKQVKKFNQTMRKYYGPVVHEGGDLYLVDCNVTGLLMGGT